MIDEATQHNVPGVAAFAAMLGNLYQPRRDKTGKEIPPSLGSNSLYGIACTCIKLSKNKKECEVCERYNAEQLESLQTPEQYYTDFFSKSYQK